MIIFRYLHEHRPRLGVEVDGQRYDLSSVGPEFTDISTWLALPQPAEAVRRASPRAPIPENARITAPIDAQEVWASGVTYLRSKVARMEESDSASDVYDRVYDAERPELFFKANPSRVVASGQPIRIRRDSTWNVPEPELALVITTEGAIAGYSIGNDVSSRSIEGENPLYLPQAKVYEGSCALGPGILVNDGETKPRTIRMDIIRNGEVAFSAETSTSQIRRRFEDLVSYLFRELRFPAGVVLFTGTGIVPSDDFTLRAGDLVKIGIEGIGMLENPVAGNA